MKLTISVKGVLTLKGGILLAKNERDEWELPGGQLEPNEAPEQTCEREILEETAIAVKVGALLRNDVFEVIPNRHVYIVSYHCQPHDPNLAPKVSHEHTQLATFPVPESLALPNLPDIYKQAIRKSQQTQTVPTKPQPLHLEQHL